MAKLLNAKLKLTSVRISTITQTNNFRSLCDTIRINIPIRNDLQLYCECDVITVTILYINDENIYRVLAGCLKVTKEIIRRQLLKQTQQ